MMRKLTMLAALALAAPAPILAQAPAAAEAPAPVDPARLKAATPVIDQLFPLGTYKRLMGDTMNKMMASMTDSMLEMPTHQLAAMGGLANEQLEAMGQAKLSEIMAIYDPHFRDRMQISNRAMMDAMVELMTKFEPQVRTGLSRAYARRFTVEELNELERFFRTPTGSAYASEAMALYMDPEVMTEMQAFMPELMQQMPQLTQKMKASTAHLPAPRKLDELSPAEREKLAKLFGVKPDELREPGDFAPDDEAPSEEIGE